MKRKPTPLDKAAWAVCPYLLHIDRVRLDMPKSRLCDCKCDKCPEWEHFKDHGKMKRACRGMAEEAVKPVLKALKINQSDNGI